VLDETEVGGSEPATKFSFLLFPFNCYLKGLTFIPSVSVFIFIHFKYSDISKNRNHFYFKHQSRTTSRLLHLKRPTGHNKTHCTFNQRSPAQ
jgi:hypothetical protein